MKKKAGEPRTLSGGTLNAGTVESKPVKRPDSTVALYRRVSTPMQARRYGLDRQLFACVKLVGKLGLPDYRLFTDKYQTGENLDRKRFQTLNKDVVSGKVMLVVAFSLSRISRRINDLWPLLEGWKKSGVRVVTVLEKYDSEEPEEIQLRRLMRYACRADKIGLKSAEKARNIKVRKGGRGPGSIPYGYMALSSGEVIVHEEKARVVKRIFRYHGKGLSDQAIADRLTEAGIAPPSWDSEFGDPVTPWGRSTIAGILANSKYVGVWEQTINGKKVVSLDIAPAIIKDSNCCGRMEKRLLELVRQ